MEQGIDISDKPALIELCSTKLKMTKEEVVSLFKNYEQLKKKLKYYLQRRI